MQSWSTWSSTREVLNAAHRVSSHDQNALSHPKAAATLYSSRSFYGGRESRVYALVRTLLWNLELRCWYYYLVDSKTISKLLQNQTLPQSPMQMDKMSSSLFGLRQRFMWPLWYSDPRASSGPVLILTDWVLIYIELLTHEGTDQNLKDLQKLPVVSCI